MTPQASADSANDPVSVDETVRMPRHFIYGTEFKIIDVGVDYKSVLALAKATEESRLAGQRAHRTLRSNGEIIN